MMIAIRHTTQRKGIRIMCLMLACFTVAFCMAQTTDSSSLSKVLELEDVVVTAEYRPNPADQSTYKIKVIDEQKIQSLAAVNLKDALSNELNIRFSQDPVLGSGMSLQGLSGQNVKILVDGVAMIGRQNGNLDLSQINLSNVERIEIVEGPLSVSYGTNALAGVINIITKKPKTNAFSVGAMAYYETNHNYNAGLNMVFRKKHHGFTCNLNRNYFNGWRKGEAYYLFPAETLADTNRYKSWKPKEQYFGDIQYFFEKDQFQLNYRAACFHELIVNRGFPLKPYYERAFDDYYKTQRLDNTLNLKFKLKNFRTFTNTLAYNYYRRDKTTYYKDLTTMQQELAADNSLQDTAVFTQWMARGSYVSAKPFEEWIDTVMTHHYANYELGYDLNYGTATGKRIQDKTKAIGDYALFASAEIQPFKHFVIRPGLRYAYNTQYASPLIPSLNLKYHSNWFSYRVSYARGFRAPDLKELYFEFVDINHNIYGNTHLKAEQSDNFNASVKYRKKRSENEHAIELAGFYNEIHNLITLALMNGMKYTYINIGAFKSYGVSANGSLTYKTLDLSAGVAFVARYNDLSGHYSEVKQFAYSPEAKVSIQYRIEKWNLHLNCFYKYTGTLPGYALAADGSPVQTRIGDFHMLDINISKQFFTQKLTISAGAKNLCNVDNVQSSLAGGGAHTASSSSTPIAMGRTYFIKLQYVFEK